MDAELKRDIRWKIADWFDGHRGAMLRDLEALINMRSVARQAENGAPYGRVCRDTLEKARGILETHGFKSEVYKDCLAIADLAGKDGGEPELGILAHTDVVDATDDGWLSPPYEMEIRGGNIYGRGATDNKGPAVASIYALACAKDVAKALGIEFKKTARLFLGSAEEIGCLDVRAYAAENPMPKYTFSPDSNYPVVNVEKGRFELDFSAQLPDTAADGAVFLAELSGGKTTNIVPNFARAVLKNADASAIDAAIAKFKAAFSDEQGACVFAVSSVGADTELTATGVAAHASNPQLGVNAQTALVWVLARLLGGGTARGRAITALAELFPHGDFTGGTFGIAAADEVSGKLTLSFNCTELSGDTLTANLDSRTVKLSDDRDLVAAVTEKLNARGFTVTNATRTGCHVVDESSPFVQTLLSVYEAYTGHTGYCRALGGTTYVHDLPGGVAFGCEMPGDDHQIHGINEFMPIANLITSAKMFTQVIFEICGVE
ncbi:MAG: Sapep family Mn(2+)-dependent dipeptidase [Oscillospiraceae bacterium]|jgi:succinyl-diaminopimelate desuccinylase|nr:Sapep family Mn(2+)-dependent dipeptidase [Oscillospiraceae bacterium]